MKDKRCKTDTSTRTGGFGCEWIREVAFSHVTNSKREKICKPLVANCINNNIIYACCYEIIGLNYTFC